MSALLGYFRLGDQITKLFNVGDSAAAINVELEAAVNAIQTIERRHFVEIQRN